MNLKSLKITKINLFNFRNYEKITFNFSENINIILGKNGVGKTNILEAIYLISNLRSFRITNELELIKNDKDFFKIELFIDNQKLSMVLNRDQKSYFINQTKTKVIDFLGNFNCLLYEPSELNLFSLGPKKRRNFIDLEISKINSNYYRSLLVYNRYLREKNELYKSNCQDTALLDSYDAILSKHIYTICLERKKLINYLNSKINNYLVKLSAKNFNLNLVYKSEFEDLDFNEILNKLNLSRTKDYRYQCCQIGIHKDDILVRFKDKELVSVASQAQKKLALLSIKLSLLDYISEKTGNKPVILLDDILSELDQQNQGRLLKLVNNDMQTIITTTDLSRIVIDDQYHLIEIK